MKRISNGKDINGYVNNRYNERPFSDTSYTNVLVQNVSVLVPVPVGATTAYFSFSGNVWVGYNDPYVPNSISMNLLLEDMDMALLEDGDNILLEGTGSYNGGFNKGIELNPFVKSVLGGSVLYLTAIDTGGSCVSIEFYQKLSNN